MVGGLNVAPRDAPSDELEVKGFKVSAGRLGENITTRGVDLLGLPTGALLRLGEQAVLEVTGLRNPCSKINDFRRGLLGEVFAMDPLSGEFPSSVASWLWSAVKGPSALTIPSGSRPGPFPTARWNGSEFLFRGHRRAQKRRRGGVRPGTRSLACPFAWPGLAATA